MKAFLRWRAPLVVAAFFAFSSGCVPTSGFTIGGKASSLIGELGVSLNGNEPLILKKGPYKFAARLEAGTIYSVAISSQPVGQVCALANGRGVVASANITDVNVICQNLQYQVAAHCGLEPV